MELLDGTELEDEMEDEEEDKAIGWQEREEIEEKEIKRCIKKLKIKKAAGIDGIPMEAWKYASEGLKRRLWDLLKIIWRKGTIPRDWRKSIIVSLYKRGEREEVGNYRSISLLCLAYKIYAEILRNKLEKMVEEKGLIPENQAGFRKGRSTIDNIFVLNHLMQRRTRQGGKDDKVYMLFANLNV